MPAGLPAAPLAGACNVDVMCTTADPLREPTRAVVLLRVDGRPACTGTLLNSTGPERKPYVLTGAHCHLDLSAPPDIVAVFGFANSTCRLVNGISNGFSGDGSQARSISGAVVRAVYTPTDTALIELDASPPISWNVYYAGWDASGATPSAVTTLHHPNGEEMRITVGSGSISLTQYALLNSPGDGTHLLITRYAAGSTEPGSDGAPLFDSAGRVVAQLHGGTMACGVDGQDWYGRLAPAWLGGGTPATSLKPWLDPEDSGVQTLAGVAGGLLMYFPRVLR